MAYSLYPFVLNGTCCMTVVILGIIIHKTLYTNIKDQEHREKVKVVQRIIKTYSIVQCIGWPVYFIVSSILFINNPILDYIDSSWLPYLLHFNKFFSALLRDYVSFNSFIIAVCRYLFIVFDTSSENIGIVKLRSIFITSSVGVPIFLSILDHSTVSTQDWMSQIGMPDIVSQKLMNSSVNSIQNQKLDIFESPIYIMVNNELPAMLIDILKIVHMSIFILIYSNLVEGIIYVHIFTYSRR